MKRRYGLAGVGMAVVGSAAALTSCTQHPTATTTTTTTIPSPALGCYTTNNPEDADAKIIGKQATLNGIEAFDPGSGCTTQDSTSGKYTYVKAADATAALAACVAVDNTTQNTYGLDSWVNPAPGLAGYYLCSPK